MPWCEPCGEYRTPNAVKTDGSCATCGAPVDLADGLPPPVKPTGAPWHFWVAVAAVSAYMLWRVVQLVALAF